MKPKWALLEEAARTVLRGGGTESQQVLRVLQPAGGPPPVACLVTASEKKEYLLFSLGKGESLVGRGTASDYVMHRNALAGVLEGAQWRIIWTPLKVTVEDAGSTNGSVLIRKADRATVSLILPDLFAGSVGYRLGWDGTTVHQDQQVIHDGDVLVNMYGPLLFVCEKAIEGAIGSGLSCGRARSRNQVGVNPAPEGGPATG